MSAAEIKETKERIIQEIQQVEDEWILKAIQKLLDMDDPELTELDKRMEKRKSGESKSYTWEEVDKELESIIKK
ncbi:MAG: hypothetical protein RJA25_1069 [Bacteroidota bacterium]|jgi:hypothetical protein